MAQTGNLRLMLVDDSAETREYLRQLLQFERHIEVVGMARNGQEAVDLATELRPDLILMDINMPVMDGISAAEIISRELPGSRIVMMSVQGEMAYLRRAMQAGAREFLIKPFTHDELMNILGEVSSLQRLPSEAAVGAAAPDMVAAPTRPVALATVVTVSSPRGGAGCSTVALNLAIALQGQRKARVLLIDGNLRYGALDAMLNLQISHSIADLIPSIDDLDPEMLHAATLPHTSGIRLLAAPPSPEMADLVSQENLRQIVTLGRQRYDYIVADVGSHLNDGALGFMDMSHCIVVLLTPDIPAVKNARLFLEVAQNLDYEPDKVKLVLNRAAPRGGITAQAVERHIKHPIVLSIPESPRVVMAAINRGVPLILYEREIDKSMPLTRQLLALTELVPRPGENTDQAMAGDQSAPSPAKAPASSRPAPPKKKGLFGGLLRRGK
jgi:pilus assembly protein CpaE